VLFAPHAHKQTQLDLLHESSDSHSGDYENYCLLKMWHCIVLFKVTRAASSQKISSSQSSKIRPSVTCRRAVWQKVLPENTESYSRRQSSELLFSPNTLTHSWSWALLEKLPVVQPLKNFPAFYWTRRFITAFTRALQWSLSWTR
jgi:hypothetical protein